MSIEHSRELIKGIADRKEADAHFEGMGKWDALSQEKGIIEPEPVQPEREMER
jgi:hypothetical protein